MPRRSPRVLATAAAAVALLLGASPVLAAAPPVVSGSGAWWTSFAIIRSSLVSGPALTPSPVAGATTLASPSGPAASNAAFSGSPAFTETAESLGGVTYTPLTLTASTVPTASMVPTASTASTVVPLQAASVWGQASPSWGATVYVTWGAPAQGASGSGVGNGSGGATGTAASTPSGSASGSLSSGTAATNGASAATGSGASGGSAGSVTGSAGAASGSGSGLGRRAGEIEAWTNATRAQHGLPPLANSPLLDHIATLKCQDMIQNHYFSHLSPTYGTPYQMQQAFGVRARIMGAENIAGARDTSLAYYMLVHSPAHLANILYHGLTDQGAAVVPYGVYGVYVCQEFIGY